MELSFDEWIKELIVEFRRWKWTDEGIVANIANRRNFWKEEFYNEGMQPKQAYYEWDTGDF
jgi:hypothetical protein